MRFLRPIIFFFAMHLWAGQEQDERLGAFLILRTSRRSSFMIEILGKGLLLQLVVLL